MQSALRFARAQRCWRAFSAARTVSCIGGYIYQVGFAEGSQRGCNDSCLLSSVLRGIRHRALWGELRCAGFTLVWRSPARGGRVLADIRSVVLEQSGRGCQFVGQHRAGSTACAGRDCAGQHCCGHREDERPLGAQDVTHAPLVGARGSGSPSKMRHVQSHSSSQGTSQEIFQERAGFGK